MGKHPLRDSRFTEIPWLGTDGLATLRSHRVAILGVGNIGGEAARHLRRVCAKTKRFPTATVEPCRPISGSPFLTGITLHIPPVTQFYGLTVFADVTYTLEQPPAEHHSKPNGGRPTTCPSPSDTSHRKGDLRCYANATTPHHL